MKCFLLNKKLSFLTILLLFFLGIQAQEEKLTEYSFSEIFQMIEEETDTVFELKNVIIKYDEKADSNFTYLTKDFPNLLSVNRPKKPNPKLVVDKHIVFDNVNLPYDFGFGADKSGMLNEIHFKKSVTFTDVSSLIIMNSVFDGHFSSTITKNKSKIENGLGYKSFIVYNNIFKKGLRYRSFDSNESDYEEFQILFRWNEFIGNKLYAPFSISIDQKVTYNFDFVYNTIKGNSKSSFFWINNATRIELRENRFIEKITSLFLDFEYENLNDILIKDNLFKNYVSLNTNEIVPSVEIEWNQFSSKLISSTGYFRYSSVLLEGDVLSDDEILVFSKDRYSDKYLSPYLDSVQFSYKSCYKAEQAQLGVLLSHYRSKFDKENANAVYAEMKDLETKRLEYLYHNNPSFDNYFSWKINQFLKTFSLYGTKPSRSVTYSIYVIFFFALVYLFFPNSWDEQGRNRIINRYTFFMKYMNKKAGIHEVYLEHNQPQILEYSAFKAMIENSDKKVPKFFTATALPLYKWAVSGTKINAKLLKRIDVLKGTWSELPTNKRFWKAFLLILIFTAGIAYDIIIKMLNALMLSINTFTTLGFGEIPIKGLPRYLAIIQGFVGWFMLTIFSVALISQLME